MATRVYKHFVLPPSRLFPDGWEGTVPDLRQLQESLAAQVSLQGPDRAVRRVAGIDVGLGRFGRQARAAAVLVDACTLALVDQCIVEQPAQLPYIPGLLSFRELPVMLEALAGLSRPPDLILCDGQGLAHPRRFGIACHLGVATGIPTIGVAKSVLVGGHAPLPAARGARVPFLIDGERVGVALRSRTAVKPLIVSPGHRVGIEAAADQVLALTTRYRLPEPTRLADRLSKAGGGAARPT